MLCADSASLLCGGLLVIGLIAGAASDDVKATKSFPEPVKRCRLEDEDCYLKQAQAFMTAFKHGVPELRVPSLEPIHVGTLHVVSGEQRPSLQFTLTMMNTTVHNFGNNVVIKGLKGFTKDLTKPLHIVLTTWLPEIELHAKYDVNGRILVLPIISKGDTVITMTDVLSKSRITAEPVTRSDGRTYLKVTDYKTVSKVGTGHFDMSNLFNNNKELRESTLKVLNDEWEAISEDVRPAINNALDRVFKLCLQRLWENIPYDEFFLD